MDGEKQVPKIGMRNQFQTGREAHGMKTEEEWVDFIVPLRKGSFVQ